MTRSQAIIWQYAQGPNRSEHSRLSKIQLPNVTNNTQQPLPLGTLVPTSGEPALLVVTPATGKIMFWESLSNAAALNADRQKQQSVQGSLSGMMSGETVVNITEAEPRGFVLTLSTGRLAHLMISDTQGKPTINTHYLRSSTSQGGGVFGSLRSVFSSVAWKRDVAAVRASHSLQRGQRFVIVATTAASFQIWSLSWNGTASLVHDVDAREHISKALSTGTEVFQDRQEPQFELLDFTIMPGGATGKEVGKSGGNSDCTLMALTVVKGQDSSKLALVGLRFTDGALSIDVVHPISCYRTSLPNESTFKPQVLVPEPAQMAFVVLQKSVILVSLLELEESPGTQLQIEAHTLPDPFQDTIDFKKSKPYRVVGCAPEPYDQMQASASCVIMIYGFGLIRVAALPMKPGQTATDRSSVTAQTKIEQAIFFGGLRQDLLDFTPRPEMEFSVEEIQQAAIDVNKSIMSSTSPYLPTISPSMELQLSRRAQALSDLNKHLRNNYPPLDPTTNWILLSNAERMAAAQELWRRYDETIQNPIKTSDSRNVFTELVEGIHPKYKNENQPDNHETDGVRHWFIHDTWRLEWAVPYAQEIVEIMFKESVEDKEEFDIATKARMVSEAQDIHLAALETALKFREVNAPAYGLGDDLLSDGVLRIGYENLPKDGLWTSNPMVVNHVKMLTDVAREMAKRLDESSEEEPIDDKCEELLLKLAQDNPRQVHLCIQIGIEQYRWLKSRNDAEDQAVGKSLQHSHLALRRELLTKLGAIAQTRSAIFLAEKYHDMGALADIIENELSHNVENNDDQEVHDALQDRIKSNFVRFGTPWANAFFLRHLDGAGAVNILDQNQISNLHLSNFLRQHAGVYAKIGWLNEVTAERNFGLATDFLEEVQKQTDNLWGQKVATSMRKLTLLAAKSTGQAKEEIAAPIIKSLDHGVATLAIQEQLYAYIKPSVADALDAEAEVDLAMERHGNDFVANKPTYQESLRRNFEKLLSSHILEADDLIDTLTMLDTDPITTDPSSFMKIRFLSALRVVQLSPAFDSSSSNHPRKSLLERTIWRRCMLRDDWPALNRTESKTDSVVAEETSQTCLFQTILHGYRAGFWHHTSQPLPPEDTLLEAGTTVEALRESSRYNKDTPDTALSALASDMALEAEQLESCITAGRLADRWAGLVEDARLAAREEADRWGEVQAEMVEGGGEEGEMGDEDEGEEGGVRSEER